MKNPLEKRLPRYHLIYEEMHENPLIPIYQITKRTGIARSTVSRYLEEMYEHSILKGPMLLIFSSFPATPTIMEVGSELLVSVKVTSSRNAGDLFSTFYDMKVRKLINTFSQACVLSNSEEFQIIL